MSDTAVIQAAGKQYLVRPGQTLRVPHLESEGKHHEFADMISGKRVRATILEQSRSPKIAVRKFKSKVRYLRRKSYRETLTVIRIEKIAK